jgi:hypothetical protein
MRKSAVLVFLFLAVTVFLFQDRTPVLAGDSANISCGDYTIITRRKGDEEQLFRINTKTGETWRFEGPDIGWVKMREQS